MTHKIKQKLIDLAANDELPLDLNELNEGVFNLSRQENDELIKLLSDGLKELARGDGIKLGSKKYLELQAAYFAGAYTSLDFVSGRYNKENKEGSLIPPSVYFKIMRGEVI